MGTQIKVPSPQHRYLEPFKNRVFQYDTKHSNYFLSRYTNQILNAVGDDSIVRGLEISPEVNPSKTGINFTIAPGALVQDLTYFEFQKDTVIEMDDIADFSDYYIVIYSNYRYIETVYENPLKFEATFYNPRTKKALSAWSTINNRIILGVYSFTIDDEHNIIEVTEEDSTIFFEEANVVHNGTFDTGTLDYWSSINSDLHIVESGGALDSPYVSVKPNAGEYQGLAQVMTTKPNATYEVSFYVKSDESVPFKVLILDKNAVHSIPSAVEVMSYEAISTKKWTLHTFRFNAFSTQSTIILLKNSESLDNNIYFDHICVFEYTPTRKRSELHNISMIDGGRIPTTEDIIPFNVEEADVARWSMKYNANSVKYVADCTQHRMMNSSKGQYLVFAGRRFSAPGEYYLDWKNDTVSFYKSPESCDEIALYFFRNPKNSDYRWTIALKEGLNIYSPPESQEIFQDPSNGQYLLFFNGKKLPETAYSIDYARNLIQFDLSIVDYSVAKSVNIYYITDPVERKVWNFNTSAGVNAYYLPAGEEDFVDETKGRYLVFLGPDRIETEDYLIKPSERSITLTHVPTENNVALKVFYFGDYEAKDETPEDEDFDEYKWRIVLKSDEAVYRVNNSRDPFRPSVTGYYVAFMDKQLLPSHLYSMDPAAGKVTFSQTVLSDGKIVELYFIKRAPEAKYYWVFNSLNANQRQVIPSESQPVLQSPDDGQYLVFLNKKQLNRSQYNAMSYASNVFQIDSSVPVPQSSRLEICFIKQPVTCSFWDFTTIEDVNSYMPKIGEDNYAETGDGEFLFFMDGQKLDSEEFRVNKLKNEVSFTSAMVQSGGNKCEIYFLGKE